MAGRKYTRWTPELIISTIQRLDSEGADLRHHPIQKKMATKIFTKQHAEDLETGEPHSQKQESPTKQ